MAGVRIVHRSVFGRGRVQSPEERMDSGRRKGTGGGRRSCQRQPGPLHRLQALEHAVLPVEVYQSPGTSARGHILASARTSPEGNRLTLGPTHGVDIARTSRKAEKRLCSTLDRPTFRFYGKPSTIL